MNGNTSTKEIYRPDVFDRRAGEGRHQRQHIKFIAKEGATSAHVKAGLITAAGVPAAPPRGEARPESLIKERASRPRHEDEGTSGRDSRKLFRYSPVIRREALSDARL
ncbi:hypothetical protein EVAR_30872_1 [Eumeta japonica]|uniref:Uncharacterized protein n=1 Tax=Eumeta variegata TaxID=151549 RepID=A0A4C1V5J7_EUMVA|nr:hypothetical protein EVAR_30872_1 [Eumeta japonica]